MAQRWLGRAFWLQTQETAENFLRSIDVEPNSRLGDVMLGQYSDAGVRPDLLSTALYLGVVSHYIEGSRYPIGGSGAIPRKMNNVIRAANGGERAKLREIRRLQTATDDY